MPSHTTPSQTVGPFFTIGMEPLYCADIAAGSEGQRIEISGRVLDADGAPVPDAILELWQADANGNYFSSQESSAAKNEIPGFGRVPTNEAGEFHFRTIKPGRVPDPSGGFQAPHILVSFFCRGLLRRLVSRIYFPNEPSNASDFALARVDPSRKDTLIARQSASNPAHLEWNIVLQGNAETVFFDC